MKNKNEILGLATNIFAAILLLAFIIVGLNLIGIYKLPAPIEKLLGSYEDDGSTDAGNDNNVYNIIDSSDTDTQFLTVDLDYSNAKRIFEELSVSRDYIHDVTVKHYFDKQVREQKISVKRQGGLYDASISENNMLLKSIQETDDSVVITVPDGESDNEISIPKGNFDLSQECGFIVNAEEFLESDVVLDEASFSQFSNDSGVFITVLFDSSFDSIEYQQKYTVSLDYGVVTEVLCYEQGELVYEMTTNALGSNH